MKKNKVTNSNGITLIVLVVTIVVLLILSGISIIMVLGNNGIITKAKEAKAKTEQDVQNTEMAIKNLYDEMDIILKGDNESSGESVDYSKFKIGDYVNYEYDTVESSYTILGTQTGDSNDQTVSQDSIVLEWQIFNIDKENDVIELISATPTEDYIGFFTAKCYNNGVYLLNDICAKLYSNKALGITARSINLADIEKHLTETGYSARNNYMGAVKYGTIKNYTDKCSYYPLLYTNQLGQGIDGVDKTDGSTIVNFESNAVDPFNESNSYYSIPTTDTYKQADTKNLTVTQTYYEIPLTSANYGNVADILNSDSRYWIGTRFTDTWGYRSVFGLRTAEYNKICGYYFYGSDNSGTGDFCWYALRPMVSLSSKLLYEKDANGAWNVEAYY